MNPIDIIKELYKTDSKAYRILVDHGERVAEKALKVAENVKHLHPDLTFIEEGAMLHDIGMLMTDAPHLGCLGSHHYVVHGILGRAIMDKMEFPKHGLVCERHLAVGILADEIVARSLPLPVRDMVPVSIEEKIVCYADKFFSKNPDINTKEKSLEDIAAVLREFGQNQFETFSTWVKLFEGKSLLHDPCREHSSTCQCCGK